MPNILWVDDEIDLLKPHILFLEQKGYNLTSCTNGTDAIELVDNSNFDIVFLDMTLPPYSEKNINTGDDLVPIVRKRHPNAKIVILTSHYESIVLFKIIKDHNPQGILIKSDLQPQELIDAFDIIVKGGTYYSKTVMNHQKSWGEKNKVMDSYNRQILFLLAQGVKTKSLPDLLHLSKSAIDKRKAILKQLLGIDKGNDEDILKEARKERDEILSQARISGNEMVETAKQKAIDEGNRMIEISGKIHETNRPTIESIHFDRIAPTALKLSGHRSSTHITMGVRLIARSKTAGNAEVIGES